jgi:hypothetical protein
MHFINILVDLWPKYISGFYFQISNLQRMILYNGVPIKAVFPFCPVSLNWLMQLLVIIDRIIALHISPALSPPCKDAMAFI